MRCRTRSLVLKKNPMEGHSNVDIKVQPSKDRSLLDTVDDNSVSHRLKERNSMSKLLSYNNEKNNLGNNNNGKQLLSALPSHLTNVGKFSVPKSLDLIAEGESEDDDMRKPPMLKHSRSTGKMKRKVFSPFDEFTVSSKSSTSSDEDEPKPKVGITQDNLQVNRGPSSSAGFINRSPVPNYNSAKVLIRQRKLGCAPLKTIESCSSADVSDDGGSGDDRGIFIPDITKGKLSSISGISEENPTNNESIPAKRSLANKKSPVKVNTSKQDVVHSKAIIPKQSSLTDQVTDVKLNSDDKDLHAASSDDKNTEIDKNSALLSPDTNINKENSKPPLGRNSTSGVCIIS